MSEHAMVPEAAAQPKAGWYDAGDGQLRYWDGRAWTQHTATAPPPAPAPEGAAAAERRAGVDVLAVVTLIVGFVPWLGCIALLTGAVSLKVMKQSGQRGRIPAIIGMTVGGLWLLDIVLIGIAAAGANA